MIRIGVLVSVRIRVSVEGWVFICIQDTLSSRNVLGLPAALFSLYAKCVARAKVS